MDTINTMHQFEATLFQRKMNKWELQTEIKSTEAKFRKTIKEGHVSEMFDLQDELGLLYKRLMNMHRIINKR